MQAQVESEAAQRAAAEARLNDVQEQLEAERGQVASLQVRNVPTMAGGGGESGREPDWCCELLLVH